MAYDSPRDSYTEPVLISSPNDHKARGKQRDMRHGSEGASKPLLKETIAKQFVGARPSPSQRDMTSFSYRSNEEMRLFPDYSTPQDAEVIPIPRTKRLPNNINIKKGAELTNSAWSHHRPINTLGQSHAQPIFNNPKRKSLEDEPFNLTRDSGEEDHASHKRQKGNLKATRTEMRTRSTTQIPLIISDAESINHSSAKKENHIASKRSGDYPRQKPVTAKSGSVPNLRVAENLQLESEVNPIIGSKNDIEATAHKPKKRSSPAIDLTTSQEYQGTARSSKRRAVDNHRKTRPLTQINSARPSQINTTLPRYPNRPAIMSTRSKASPNTNDDIGPLNSNEWKIKLFIDTDRTQSDQIGLSLFEEAHTFSIRGKPSSISPFKSSQIVKFEASKESPKIRIQLRCESQSPALIQLELADLSIAMSLHKYLLGLGHKMIPRTRDYLDKTFIKDMTTDPGQLVNQTSPIRHTEIPLPNQKKPRGAAHPDGINIDGEDNLRPRISPNHRKHGTEPNELRVSRKVSPNRREKIKSKMISHSSHLDKCAESDSPRKRIHSSMEAPTSNHATRSRVQSVVGHSDSPVEIYGLSSNQRDVVKNSKAPEKPAQSLNRLMVSVEIETPSKATANNLEFSYGTRPKASPSLLPSQSRSTRASSKVFAHQDHHTHEFPEEERYSKRIGLGTPWHCALVYPSEGPRKATVDFGDLDRLDEGQFLNDNIIAFHLRYLEEQFHKSNPETAKKVYMFNTFFYERLTSSSRRGIDYEAVKKWTSKIDIFDYDFLVVPINESAHWYVAIICNLPNLPTDAENFPPPATSELQKDRETIFEPDSYHILTDEDPKPETKSITPSSKSAEKGLSELNLEDSEAEEIDNSRSFQGTDAARAYAHTDPDKDIDSEEWPPEHEESLGAANPVKIFHPTVNPEDNSESHLIAEDIYAFPDETLKPIVDASPQSKNGKRKSLPPLKKYDVDKPVIISMDSLGVTHSATARNLKEYLVCESKRKPSLSLSVSDISGMTARGIPEQDNFCDCGIFLLAYMEKFLNDPQGLVKKILQRELDQAFDWPTMNASKMRHDLRDLIQNLWNQQNELIAKERRQKALQNGHYHGKTGAKPIENIKAPSLEHSSAWPNFSSQNDEPRDLIETPEDSCPGSSRINGEGGSVPKQNHTFETTTVPPVTPDRCTTAQHNPEELDISDLLFSQKRHTDPKLPNSMKAVSPQHEAQEISKSPILSYRSPQRISLRKIRRSFTPPQIQQERRQISPHKVSKPGTKSAAKPLGMAAKDRDLSPSKIRHHGHSGSDLSDDELQKDFNCLKPHLKAPMEITGHPSGRPVVFDEG